MLRLAVPVVLAAAASLAVPRASAVQRDPARPGTGAACPPLVPADGAALTPPEPAREFRAAWVSPVDRGEWPSRAGMSDAEQRAELTALLDRAAAIGLNALVLHVRPAADALYPTSAAPWSSYLVGSAEAAPGYDPLAFAVAESHRRGLQLHVWFNPFRAATPDGRGAAGARRIAREHPEWLVRYGSQQWIDPGYPEARRWVLSAIGDVVDRYDVDGVHLDDYFYPYLEERTTVRYVGTRRKRKRVVTRETIAFPDERSWRSYGAAQGWSSRGDWRRANVSSFVEAMYRDVKLRKPWVLVGISPFGIWRPGSPPGVSGLDAYTEIFADSRRWLRQGWLDYVAPQLYWTLDGEQRRFLKLDAWWRAENVHRRHVWPGLFTARTHIGSTRWSDAEVRAQVQATRTPREAAGESLGHVHFRMASLMPRVGALGNRLAAGEYAEPALPPASPWLGAAVPAAPTLAACPADSSAITTVAAGGAHAPAGTVAMAPGDTVGVRWWLVQLGTSANAWSQRLYAAGQAGALPVRFGDGSAADVVAVRAVSRTGVVSAPAVFVPAVPTAAGAR